MKFLVFFHLLPTFMLATVMFFPNVASARTLGGKEVVVSYYGTGGKHECGKNRPCHGSLTACGQVFNKNHVSVASETLPCGTPVQFCYEGKCLVAEVTDRGAFERLGRKFDLSFGAARKLGIVQHGIVRVKATILSRR